MNELTQRLGTRASARLSAIAVLALCCAVFSLLVAACRADAAGSPDFRRFVTIKFDSSASASDRSAAREEVGAQIETTLLGPRLQQVSLPQGHSSAAAAEVLGANADVEYAVPSGTWTPDDAPEPFFNDPFLVKQWALSNTGQVFMTRFVSGQFEQVSGTPGADIGAPAGWAAIDQGALARERIGVIDTGVAYEHPDLEDNMVEGQDFYDGDRDPRDPNGHGTHVASIAAGVAGNGIGTAGVDPWGRVMPLRAADRYGNFSWAAIEQAVVYGLDAGVRVFNGSFGGADNDPAFEEIIREHPEALFVFSAGNGGSDGVGDNHDAAAGTSHRYPCDIGLQNVICVGASDWRDSMTGFSDFGVNSVDLLAPGASIYAAKPCTTPATSAEDQGECPYNPDDPTAPVGLGGGPFAFQLLSGTSMSAPAVAGAVSLIWEKCPQLMPSQVKSAVLTTVDPLAAASTKVAYGGRLDVGNATAAVSPCPAKSDGTDWPTPPTQPTDPGGDGGDSGGGGNPITPPAQPPKNSTLRFQIIRPTAAKLTRKRIVKFKLRCDEVCSAALTAQAVAKRVALKKTKAALGRGAPGTRTVSVKLSSATARKVRALLAARTAVRLKISIVVTDSAGISSEPLTFSIKLAR